MVAYNLSKHISHHGHVLKSLNNIADLLCGGIDDDIKHPKL